jgi:hypothetical protein
VNNPGTATAGQNVLWIGQGQNDTLTVQDGGTAVFDLRVRSEQANHNGVLLDGRAVINAGGLLRMQQSLSSFSSGVAAGNVGDIIIRGDIEGQGTTAKESVVDIQLPAPQATGSTGVPQIINGQPAAGVRPHGGLRFEDTTGNADLIVNGTGFGGLRINASPRPAALFSGATPDPVSNATKISDALPAARLARVSGTGGYLTLAPPDQTYNFPAGGEWADPDVGLKVVNHNSTGTDVSLGAVTSWSKNLAVDTGATLDAGTGPFTFDNATLGRHGYDCHRRGGIDCGHRGAVSPGLGGIGTLTVGNITLNGSLVFETTNAPSSDLLSVTGNITLGAVSHLTLPSPIRITIWITLSRTIPAH